MAIVQISRIQNRRGRELTETGLPQLSGGEIGWAMDTQKLYIGNGSVAEGAPAVGNTNILTEHSDIFALANQYVYKETSNLWGAEAQPPQSLQEKLDQVVTVFDFGVVGDGATDDTDNIQLAIDSLYLRALDKQDRVALHMPAGVYRVNGTLYLPPFVTIFGDGIGKTIINSSDVETGQDDLFVTIPGSAQPGVYTGNVIEPIDSVAENQARHIYLSDMTIKMNRLGTCFNLDAVARSTFRNLRLEGTWLDLIGVNNPSTGVSWFNTYPEGLHHAFVISDGNGVASSKENKFENIQVTKFYDILQDLTDGPTYSRRNNWMNCDFTYMKKGMVFGVDDPATTNGPSHNLIHGCTFDKIEQEGIVVDWGEYNITSHNNFYSVGNGGENGVIGTFGGPAQSEFNIIKFTNNFNNTSTNDYFERTATLTKTRNDTGQSDPQAGEKYIAEVGGQVDYNNIFRSRISIGYTLVQTLDPDDGVTIITTEFIDLLKLPLYTNGTVEIDYVYVGSRENGVDPDIFARKEGTVSIQVHSDDENAIIINDEADFQGDTIYQEEIEFGAYIDSRDGEDTLIVTVKNLIPIEEDSLTYNYRVKS